ncbi:MAG: hypothetical protein ACI9V1_000949 [Spirosomataceae bacterium]|jgi:hypothetical protein
MRKIFTNYVNVIFKKAINIVIDQKSSAPFSNLYNFNFWMIMPLIM